MPLTDDPKPRVPPGKWEPFIPMVRQWHHPDIPVPRAPREFGEVLRSRRSAVAGPLGFDVVAELLWYAAGTKGAAPAGRAGLPVEWRASPSSGGLHPIHILCIGPKDGEALFYDATNHGFGDLEAVASSTMEAHRAQLGEVLGSTPGWTFRFFGDWLKIDAAYENAESLLLRDAGCLIATAGLCAEWLGIRSCPLGFLGQALCAPFGFPPDRFRAVGGIHLTA